MHVGHCQPAGSRASRARRRHGYSHGVESTGAEVAHPLDWHRDVTEHGHTGEDLLRGADAALYSAKSAVATALFVQRSIPLRLSDRRLAEISGVIATMPSPSSVERGPRNRRFVGFTMGSSRFEDGPIHSEIKAFHVFLKSCETCVNPTVKF